MQKRTMQYVNSTLIFISLALAIVFGISFAVMIIVLFSMYIMLYIYASYRRIGWLTKSLLCLLIVVFISFIWIELAIVKDMGSAEEFNSEDIDFVIILGAGLDGDQVSKTLKQRLDRSVELIKKNEHIKIILSGGQGKDELFSEAKVMGKYLIDLGISGDRLIFEKESTTTKENLSYSKALVAQLGSTNPRILLITSDYHMYRAKNIARLLIWIL